MAFKCLTRPIKVPNSCALFSFPLLLFFVCVDVKMWFLFIHVFEKLCKHGHYPCKYLKMWFLFFFFFSSLLFLPHLKFEGAIKCKTYLVIYVQENNKNELQRLDKERHNDFMSMLKGFVVNHVRFSFLRAIRLFYEFSENKFSAHLSISHPFVFVHTRLWTISSFCIELSRV